MRPRRFKRLYGALLGEGYQQQDLAEHLGLSTSAISTRFRGINGWRLHEMYEIMDLLQKPHEQLYIYFPPEGVDIELPEEIRRVYA